MNNNIIKFKVIESETPVDSDTELNVSQEIVKLIYQINEEHPLSYSRIVGELEIAKHIILKAFFEK